MDQNEFLVLVNKCKEDVDWHISLASQLSVEEQMIDLYQRLNLSLDSLIIVINAYDLAEQHINRFDGEIRQVHNYASDYIGFDISNISPEEKHTIKEQLENRYEGLKIEIEKFEFSLDFFSKLGFFNTNVVAIGANGSGKTTLSNHLKTVLPRTSGIVISAQKLLIIPTFSGISNSTQTFQKLTQSQLKDKSLRATYQSSEIPYGLLGEVGSEFQLLLDNLLAERNAARNKYFNEIKTGDIPRELPISKLDQAFEIWNSLIQHRFMECEDGINITLNNLESQNGTYAAHNMSDGEKVALFHIAQVLQAPETGFIIVDEPEMYLHKTILTKLWDTLENLRKDCIFVYLTHDLDFACNRINAKKVWIRSFSPPNNWNIEHIPENELPEPLLLELLGSRKNILFCEGVKGSIDEKIYNILFPELTVIPAESCLSVIAYTKAFNKIPDLNTNAMGIIDADHHEEVRLTSLEADNVFSYSMPDPENLFLDEGFLSLLADKLMIEDKSSVIAKIKDEVISIFEREIELQVSNFMTSKINYYFNDSHVSKGNSLQEVEENYMNFTNHIDIPSWFEERNKLLKKIIEENDYVKVLSVFNHKGLKRNVNNNFNITNFSDRAMQLLQNSSEAQDMLRTYYPESI